MNTGIIKNEKVLRLHVKLFHTKWAIQGLNLGPPDYESVALTN